jgi:hypothetical protein
MGIFKDRLGEITVPGEGVVSLPAGTVILDYEEERKGRSTRSTGANLWKGVPEGAVVTVCAADGGEPLPIERPAVSRDFAGVRRAGSRYGTLDVGSAGDYLVRVEPFAAERELFDPRIVFKA